MTTLENRIDQVSDWKRRKLEKDFVVFYQMQYALGTGKVVGMEALLRRRQEVVHNIAPEDFIERSIRDGGIINLGFWVLEKSLAFLNSLGEAIDENFRIAVNVAPAQLVDENFSEQVAVLLAQMGVSGSCLELEITENAPILNMQQVVRQMDKLSAMGVKVVLDDFGTGYTSLPYLASLPIDGLKIDKRFTNQIACKKNQAIVRSIMGLAGELGLSVVAEGIETSEQKIFYSGFDVVQGAMVGQGYYLHLPAAADDVKKALAALQLNSHEQIQFC